MAVSLIPRSTKRQRKAVPTLRAFDLFAGVGGFRMGSSAAQSILVKTVASCEIDKNSVRSYRAMFGSENEHHISDIRSLTRGGASDLPDFLQSRARRRQIQSTVPEHDILFAGFPCQPHSLMGNRQGLSDDRGELFFDIAEVLAAREPEHFVLENVRAIKSVNHGILFDTIVSVLTDDLGYNLRVWELNAADFGTPQVRRRIFFVGSKGPLPSTPPQAKDGASRLYPTVWHLLEREVDDKYYLSDRILETILKDQHKGYRRKADINRLVARPLTRTMHKMHRASQDNYYSDPFIHGTFDPVSSSVHEAKDRTNRIRRITPREAFRIQGFPETLINRVLSSGVSDTQLYMQAGNAVPPCLVSSVIDHAFGEPREDAI